MVSSIIRFLPILALLCTLAHESTLLSQPAHSLTLVRYPALIDTLIGGHYKAAEEICGSITRQDPEHPAGYYARATTLYSKFIDLEDTTGHSEFYDLIDSCLAACKQYLGETEDQTERALLYYLRGSAFSIKGLTYRQDGRGLAMIRLLMESHSSFDRAIKNDSKLFDAYLGRGAYRFGVAREASLLSWLPFIPSRQSGLDDMWLAVDSSDFSKYPALSALVWFAIEDQDYTLADSICLAGLTRFPESRAFLWPRLASLQKQLNYPAADSVARVLLDQYIALESTNGYDITGLYATLSQLADSMRNPEEAVEFARLGLTVPRTPYAENRRKHTLKILRQRLKESTKPLK